MAVISASDVVHPFDESAKRQLEAMSGLQATVQAYLRVFSEREAHNAQLSECLRLGPKQVPEIAAAPIPGLSALLALASVPGQSALTLRESRWNRVVQWMLSKQSSHPMLAVRVREIQVWTATPTFARLAEVGAAARAVSRCGGCAQRVEPEWRHCQSCGGALAAAAAVPASFRATASVPAPRDAEPDPRVV